MNGLDCDAVPVTRVELARGAQPICRPVGRSSSSSTGGSSGEGSSSIAVQPASGGATVCDATGASAATQPAPPSARRPPAVKWIRWRQTGPSPGQRATRRSPTPANSVRSSRHHPDSTGDATAHCSQLHRRCCHPAGTFLELARGGVLQLLRRRPAGPSLELLVRLALRGIRHLLVVPWRQALRGLRIAGPCGYRNCDLHRLPPGGAEPLGAAADQRLSPLAALLLTTAGLLQSGAASGASVHARRCNVTAPQRHCAATAHASIATVPPAFVMMSSHRSDPWIYVFVVSLWC